MLDSKKDKLLMKTFIVIIMTAIEILLNIYSTHLLKFILSFIILIITGYILSKNIKHSLILTIIFELIITFSELLLFVTIEFTGIIRENDFTSVVYNLFVVIIGIIIIEFKIPKKQFSFINNITKEFKNKEIINYSMLIIIIITSSTIESYMNLPISAMLIFNIFTAFVLIIIIIRFINTKSKYERISNKYHTSITSLKESEAMIDKFRVNTHENKNELMTIRNMVKSNDKNVIDYIDALVDNKIKDNEKIMYQTSKIPEGGLRATIYSKLCVMDKYKIKYKLDISKDVRTVDLINLDEELILNICKILGVFMDNAIEAVRNLKKREINIELYVIDKELYIDITNNFKGEIDLSKIGHERHTTKGEEHGYGLLLVNKIINENKKYLENEKSINGDHFTQTLKIKI